MKDIGPNTADVPMKASEIIRRAAFLLLDKGWCQHTYTNDAGHIDLRTALVVAAGEPPTGLVGENDELQKALDVVLAEIRLEANTATMGLSTWNDAPDRCSGDIYGLLSRSFETASAREIASALENPPPETFQDELNCKFAPAKVFVAGYVRAFDLVPVVQLRIDDAVYMFNAHDARENLGMDVIKQAEAVIKMADGLQVMSKMEPKLTNNDELVAKLHEVLGRPSAEGLSRAGLISVVLGTIDNHYGAK